MIVKPFAAVRPQNEFAHLLSSLPDGSNERGAMRKPLAALHVDVDDLPISSESTEVYRLGRKILDDFRENGTYLTEDVPCFYLYELEQNGRCQVGIVAGCSIDDYSNGTIKKHENTIEAKEMCVVRRLDTLNSQDGPIYLAYRNTPTIDAIVAQVHAGEPLYSFYSSKGVRNTVWRIADAALVEALVAGFEEVPTAYIADGHHRAAAAVHVGYDRRELNGTFVGAAEPDYFMSVLFPADQLAILSFSRIVHDLNGLTVDEFIERLTGEGGAYDLLGVQDEPFLPTKKGEMGVYVGGRWYAVAVHDDVVTDDPVFSLDVALLQTHVLRPILGIDDPRTNERLEFLGEVRGIDALVDRVDHLVEENGIAVAFTMFPTSIEEFMAVADAGRLMPPKSTCFEPKLRSGLFIRELA